MKYIVIIILFLAGFAFGELTPAQISFNSGEVSLIEGRSDLVRYNNSCAELENMFVLTQGPIIRRPGTKFISAFEGIELSIDDIHWPMTYIANNGSILILDEEYNEYLDVDISDAGISPSSGCATIAIDKLGHIAAGASILNRVTDQGVYRMSLDGVIDDDFYTLADTTNGWDAGLVNGVCSSIKFTDDSLYMYCTFSTGRALYKFDNTTGDEEWNIAISGSGPTGNMAVDSSDNAYVPYINSREVRKYSGTDGSLLKTYSNMGYLHQDIIVDEDNNKLFVCGGDAGKVLAPTSIQIACCDLDTGSNISYYSIEDSGVDARGMVLHNDKLFVVSENITDGNSIFRFDLDLTLEKSYATGAGTYSSYIWIDWEDNIVVRGAKLAPGSLFVFDDDLNLLATYSYSDSSAFKGSEGRCLPERDITFSPLRIEITAHGWSTGDEVCLSEILGTTELNDNCYTITVIDDDNFYLDGTIASDNTAYVSGGTSLFGSGGEIRLIPFEHSKSDAYVLSFSNRYLNFFRETD